MEFVEFDDGQFTLPIIGQYETPGHCYGVAEQDGIVYLADEYSLILLEAPELNEAGPANIDVPKEFDLLTTYPNPFNSITGLSFGLSESGLVQISIFDVSGRQIASLKNEQMNAGNHQIQSDARDNANGVYIVQMRINDYIATRKIVLVK